MRKLTKLAMAFFGLMLATTVAYAASGRAKVIINGAAAPVNFNDGDSFKVLQGKLSGTRARLAGFNTLESHGPVHSWGSWTTKELYINAKMATRHAREGAWTCQSDGDRDVYGRMLFDCPNLRASHVKHGFAHAMTITAEPAAPDLLALQQEAIANKRGMWAHGVPEYVMTSTHSIDEYSGRTHVYNRLVSTIDGHSEKERHHKTYKECERVCSKKVTIAPDVMSQSVVALRKNTAIEPLIGKLTNAQLEHLVHMWLKLDNVAALIPRDQRDALEPHLQLLTDSGMLKAASIEDDSCMIYVAFKRRYGRNRAACLQ